jgi:predicted metal-dependent phosphoesterase TrpH
VASKLSPLLCELHAHTTWSDGALTPRELIDLYGRAGFDVLAITDHTVDPEVDGHVREDNYGAYLDELREESERARRLYDLLVIPGLELTAEDDDPVRSGHALALGLRSFVGVEGGLEHALRAARAHGAALVAAHPYLPTEAHTSSRRTAAFASDPDRWAPLVDRFELFNRDTLFGWVAAAKLPAVACGDFHVPAHLATWKTLLPCAKEEQAVLDYLRSPRPAFLVRLDREPDALIQAA